MTSLSSGVGFLFVLVYMSAIRHVTPIEHIILIPIQPVLIMHVFADMQQIPIA
jgi:hypothetical protein